MAWSKAKVRYHVNRAIFPSHSASFASPAPIRNSVQINSIVQGFSVHNNSRLCLSSKVVVWTLFDLGMLTLAYMGVSKCQEWIVFHLIVFFLSFSVSLCKGNMHLAQVEQWTPFMLLTHAQKAWVICTCSICAWQGVITLWQTLCVTFVFSSILEVSSTHSEI